MNRTAAATLAVATLLTVPAFAGNHGGPGGPRHDGPRGAWTGEDGERFAERHAERLTRALDLTEAQQVTLETLQTTLTDTLRPIFASMRDTRDELQTMLDATHPDPAAVGVKAIALHRAKESMRGAHDTFETGLVAMLTETQRAQYEALRDARPDHDRLGRFQEKRRE